MKKAGNVLVFVLAFAASCFCGYLLGEELERCLDSFAAFPMALLWLVVTLCGWMLGGYLQIALHEAGHLAGGLFTGYRFSSYRIASLMLLRTESGYRIRRLTVAGTGGQCLMAPPQLVDGRIPYVIYNLGGAIVNLLSVPLFGALWYVTREGVWLSPFFACAALLGIIFALTNGLPLRTGMVDNDGRNALMLGRHPDALRAFWVQMQVNAELAAGKRLREMPDEWFAVEGLDTQNTMTAALAVFACNRLVDAQEFDEADRRMSALIGEANGVIELHRRLLTADVMYIAWLRGDMVRADSYHTKEQKKFMRSMKNFPSVIRTCYAEALLADRDDARAAKFAEQFECVAKQYPYPTDIASERELMQRAREAADARD